MDQPRSVIPAASGMIRVEICASYTSRPFVDAFRRWCGFTGLQMTIDAVPDYQMIRHLMEYGTGDMTRVDHVVLTRINDIVGENRSPSAQSRLNEFVLLMEQLGDTTNGSVVCCVCPRSSTAADDPYYEEFEQRLLNRLAAAKTLSLIPPRSVEEQYNVSRIHDPYSERYALLPYTDRYLEALGLLALRTLFHAHHVFELKAIVADCDGTLWNGVCAEEDPSNIHVDDRCAHLQHVLLKQYEAGRLICLSSKNREEDVRNAFDCVAGMVLRWENIAAKRISWDRKSSALDSIAHELNIATDTILFLDDNEIECEEVRTHHPESIVLHVSQGASITDFLNHLWVLDNSPRGNHDINRTQYFHDELRRGALLQTTGSFAEFMKQLSLEVEIRPMTANDVDRVLELTARTTQFTNAQGRITVQELKELQAESETEINVVTASDRFGDYGIVGVLIASGREAFQVHVLLLSCRVLGKGIEHRILAAIGQRALVMNLQSVVIYLRETERNLPIRVFLQSYGPIISDGESGTSKLLRYDASLLADIRYDPERDRPLAGSQRNSGLHTTTSANIQARRFLEVIANLGKDSSLHACSQLMPHFPEMTR